MSTSQPPPTLVPVEMKRVQSVAAYEEQQMNALYHLWVKVQALLTAGGNPLVSVKTIRATAVSTTFVATDHTVKATASGITVTLLTAVGNEGRIFVAKNSSTGNITLDGDGTETIDDSLTASVPSSDAVTVQSDGANWIII